MPVTVDQEIETAALEQCLSVDKMDPFDLTKTLAIHMNLDTVFIEQRARQWITRPLQKTENSEQESLQAVLEELLSSPVHLELVYHYNGKRHVGTVYPFGVDRPRFSFGADLLASDPVALACLARLVQSGHGRDGPLVFKKEAWTPDKSQVTYSDFTLNETFARFFDRQVALMSYLLKLMADTEMLFYASDNGSGKPDTELPHKARITLLQVFECLLVRMTDIYHVAHESGRRPEAKTKHWINRQTMEDLERVKALCEEKSRFSTVEFSKLFAQFIERAGLGE